MKRYMTLALMSAVLLTACTSSLRTFEAVDSSNKTITVPPGGGLTGAVKEALANDGWKIVVYRGPEVTQRGAGDPTRLERFKTFKTRYALFIQWRQVDIGCAFFGPGYSFDISMVDNDTSTEVLTLTGRGCEGGVVDKFRDALKTPKS